MTPARSAPRLGKQLRRANHLLRETERVLHDLPDHLCPRLLLERIEPNLGRGRATFLTHWPAPQAALARRDPADLPRAKALNAAFEYSPYLWDPQPISDDIKIHLPNLMSWFMTVFIMFDGIAKPMPALAPLGL